jgi:hypothetical protein
VSIKPGRAYVASYRAERGRYAVSTGSLSRTNAKRTRDLTATRGVYTYGRGVPSRVWETSNYLVDVRFVPRAGTKPSSPAQSTPPPSSSVAPVGPTLTLPRIPWEGGPAYWSRFPKAAAWTDPGFFPVGVFYGKPSQAAALHSMGVNTFLGAEHDGSPVSAITGKGSYLIAQDEWTRAQVGNDPRVVGWLVSDECDMGLGFCGGGDEYTGLRAQQNAAATLRGYQDGRFLESNFGNGILRTYWSRHVMPQLVQTVDAASSDQYAYTSPTVDNNVRGSGDWPLGANPSTSAAYGWQMDQMKRFQDPGLRRPIWAFVEVKRPYLNDAGARSITPDQIEGAIWASIIHEARGIMFFQHNNDPSCGGYALVDCGPAIQSKVTSVTSDIRSLAPVLNTQSYVWDFAVAADTMLKSYGGDAYVFAGVGLNESAGSKTFHLPPGVNGTQVTVMGENRTIPVLNGTFTDSFAAESTHHVYKVSLS